jgi:hypothetical protein
MPNVDRDYCRRAAAECVALARSVRQPAKKEVLLTRAQEWLKLAYSDHDAELEGLLSEFNRQQMSVSERPGPRAQRTRRQPQKL